MPLIRRTLQQAAPTHALALGLDSPDGLAVLEARGPGGWGSMGGGGLGAGWQLLAARPCTRFDGGFAAFERACAWLAGECAAGRRAWVIGSLAYELGCEFEPGRLGRAPAGLPPPVELAGYRAVYARRPDARSGEVVGSDPAAVERLAHDLCAPCPPDPPAQVLPPARSRTRDADYRASVERALAWIRAGDVYQVNLSRRLDLPAPGPRALRHQFARLAQSSDAPFAALLESPTRRLLSDSPERFLGRRGARVETWPIKGTRPRGSNPAEDRYLKKALAESAKDRAEHLMIVDLERNDLGRVCRTGSVRVRELAATRSFSSVHHLVSRVEGRLARGAGWPQLLRATFPGGSITGAPKLRAMQIIRELEPVARDVYTGAIGFMDSAGCGDWSIAIRTAVATGDAMRLHLGGGIVADSEPRAELAETRAKGRAFSRLWKTAL